MITEKGRGTNGIFGGHCVFIMVTLRIEFEMIQYFDLIFSELKLESHVQNTLAAVGLGITSFDNEELATEMGEYILKSRIENTSKNNFIFL